MDNVLAMILCTMHPDWQARGDKTPFIGFNVTFKDGYRAQYKALIDIPDSVLKEHGRVQTAKEIKE